MKIIIRDSYGIKKEIINDVKEKDMTDYYTDTGFFSIKNIYFQLATELTKAKKFKTALYDCLKEDKDLNFFVNGEKGDYKILAFYNEDK